MENLVFGILVGIVLTGIIMIVVLLVTMDGNEKTTKDEFKDQSMVLTPTQQERLREHAKQIERISLIRYLCSRGMSQRQIAKVMGMAQSRVCRIMQQNDIRKGDKL